MVLRSLEGWHSSLAALCSCVILLQALMHLLLDLGELGATVFILWRCLRAYQPLALGWFRARARPLRSWLCPALLACAFFPLVDLAAARSQVRDSPQTFERRQVCLAHHWWQTSPSGLLLVRAEQVESTAAPVSSGPVYLGAVWEKVLG